MIIIALPTEKTTVSINTRSNPIRQIPEVPGLVLQPDQQKHEQREQPPNG
jgi:hypothetical protein